MNSKTCVTLENVIFTCDSPVKDGEIGKPFFFGGGDNLFSKQSLFMVAE